MSIAPDKLPEDTTRVDMRGVLESTPWRVGAQRNNARAIREALVMAEMMAGNANVETCPVLLISPLSVRYLRHYYRCQSFGLGMGGTVQPRSNLEDADVRTIQAFNIVASERERLRRLDKGAVA